MGPWNASAPGIPFDGSRKVRAGSFPVEFCVGPAVPQGEGDRVDRDSLLGTTLAERYRLDALLGEGGMGKVYAAEHILMRKRLAVKVLHRQLTQVPEVVRRFEREALAAAHIDHPNVAAATDFGKLPDGSVFLVLEYVEGRSLRDEIAEGPLPVPRALHIARQIASGLAAAHRLSIVHRDLKPENVLLVHKGNDPDFVKVLDFGIAKVPLGEEEGTGEGKLITKAGMIYGTPEYMAPEQALGGNVDTRADLYALGVILYEMLAGVRPFAGKSQVGLLGQQLTQPVPSFAERAPGTPIPPAVESLVRDLLAREADERVQTAEQLLERLDTLLGDEAVRDGAVREGAPSTSFDGASGAGFGLTPSAPFGSALALGERASRGSLASHPGVALPGVAESPSAGSALPGPSLRQAASRPEPLVSRLRRMTTSARRWPPQVPRKVLLPLGGVLATGVLVLGVGLLRGDPDEARGGVPRATATEPANASESAQAPADWDARVAEAEKEGVAALQRLAEEQPSDARAFVALAARRAKDGDFTAAVEDVTRALTLDPKLYENPRLAGVLFRAAQDPKASAAAFRLLRGPFGTRGADILYDLAHTPGVRAAVKKKARDLVEGEAFSSSASPALVVALELRRARGCAQYRALLERAQHVGDARALELLRPLTETTGCGADKQQDCYPCLRGDEALALAISTIEKRIAPPADATPSR